ncbi:MAG: hypothetical protein ACUVUF_08615 [Candidatus Bathycorpusculaceae bacterium]
MGETKEDFNIFMEDFVDLLNGLEASIVQMKQQITKLVGVAEEKQKWNWNPAKIKWETVEGFKGEYERSEDVNSLDFKALLKDLAQHGGKLSRDSYFYWTFSTVGRKKRGSQP